MSNAEADDDAGTGMLKFLGSENIGNCENVAEFLCFDKFKCDKVITKPPLDHSFSNSYSFFGSSGIWKLEFMVFEKLLNRSHQRGKNISQNVAHCYAVTVQGTGEDGMFNVMTSSSVELGKF